MTASQTVGRWLRRPQPDEVCATVFVLAHAALLLAWPAILAQDAPLWISEAALLHSSFHSPPSGGCQLVTALPPNAISQAVMALMCAVVSPDVAGRLYNVACVALFAAALVYLCRARATAGREWIVCSCLPLCIGYPLFHGFLNYMTALPALCFGIGVLLRRPAGRGVAATSMLVGMPLFTYLCHGTAVGIWAVLVMVHVWVWRSRGFAVRALLGFVPVVLLIGLYVAQRQAEGATVLWSAGGVLATIGYRVRAPLRFFSVFPGFEPMVADPTLAVAAPLLMIVNVGYAVALSVIGIRWAWRARRSTDPVERWLSASLLVLAGLFVIMPHDVAGMLNPAERLLVPAACIGAAGVTAASGGRRSANHQGARLRYASYVLLGAQWAYLAVWGTQAAHLTDAFLQTLDRYSAVPGVQVVEADGVFLPAEERSIRLPRPIELMTRHHVLLHQDILDDWTHGRAIAPPTTGLFRCPGRRATATDLAALRSAGQILLLIGDPARSSTIAQLLEPDFHATRSGPGFWTLVRSNAAPGSRLPRNPG